MDDKILIDFMGEIKESVGRIEAKQDNTHSYLEAVNVNGKKTAEKLEEHVKDDKAHGASTRREVWSLIGKILTVGITVIGGVVSFVQFLKHRP